MRIVPAPTLAGLALVLAASAALPAGVVTLTPTRRTFTPGATTPFRFQAHLEGAKEQPAWIWTLESFDGTPRPASGGTLSPEGDYTPPRIADEPRGYRVRATAAHDPTLTATALVRVVPATDVTVTPARRTLAAGSAPMRFQARLEGATEQPAWIWTVESFTGTPHPPSGGTISAAGDYTPPRVALRTRAYRIRATAADHPTRSGTTLVRIHPAHGTERVLEEIKTHGGELRNLGGRLEILAGTSTPSDRQVDAPVGRDVRFMRAVGLASAPRTPWKVRGQAIQDAWLVVEEGATRPLVFDPCPAAIRLVAADGRTETLTAIPVGAMKTLQHLSVRPWRGPEDGDWEAVVWEMTGQRVWRLDGNRRLSPGPRLWAEAQAFSPTDSPHCRGLVVDGQGTIFMAETTPHGVDPQDRRSTLMVARPGDEQFSILAGSQDVSAAPRDGTGSKAVLGDLEGLVMDPDRGLLYTLERTRIQPKAGAPGHWWDPTHEVRLVVIDPRDGKVATLPRPVCTSGRSPWDWEAGGHLELGWFRGRLVLNDRVGRRIYLVDPATAAARVIVDLGPARNRQYRMVAGAVGDRHVKDDAPGVAYPGWNYDAFAVAPDGRIAILADNQVGLLLLDWERLGLPGAGPVAGDGRASAAERAETKGDAKASGEERKVPKGDGKTAP